MQAKKDARRWLIPGFVSQQGIVLVSGQQKLARKTLFADMLTLCGATKTAHSMVAPVRPINILYIEEEGEDFGTHNTFSAMGNGIGVDPKSISNVFYAFHDRVTLDTPRWRKHLVSKIKEHEIDLVILDALTYLHEGDESSTADMVRVVKTLQDLRAAGAAVMCLAHLDKQRGEDPSRDIDTQIRGSATIVNAYDVHLALRRYREKQRWVDLTVRQRHGPEEHLRIYWDLQNNPDKSLKKVSFVIRPRNVNPSTQAVQEQALQSLEPDTEYSLTDLIEAWCLPKDTASTLRNILLKQGALEKYGRASYRLAKND
jgi:hypothetical protein